MLGGDSALFAIVYGTQSLSGLVYKWPIIIIVGCWFGKIEIYYMQWICFEFIISKLKRKCSIYSH